METGRGGRQRRGAADREDAKGAQGGGAQATRRDENASKEGFYINSDAAEEVYTWMMRGEQKNLQKMMLTAHVVNREFMGPT